MHEGQGQQWQRKEKGQGPLRNTSEAELIHKAWQLIPLAGRGRN